MATIVVFDPSSTPNKVLQIILSASSPDYAGRTDVLVNPDLSVVAGTLQKYWKHLAGVITTMTVAEQTAVDAANAAAAIALMRSDGVSLLSTQGGSGIIQRAVTDIMKDELNILRQWMESFKAQTALSTNLADFKTRVSTLPAMPDRTLAQLRTAIVTRINSGTVDT